MQGTVTTLSNGVTLVVTPIDHVHSVSVIYYIRVGSRYESDAQAGMSHLIEHMLFKGTERYPTARGLSEAVENLGGDFNGGTGKEITDYSIKINSDYLESAINVLTDLIRAPRFDAAELEKERRVIIEELNMYKDTPQEWVQIVLDDLLFTGTPLGREVAGTRESVSTITRADMQAFFNQYYVPANLTISVAGRVQPSQVLSLVRDYLGDWKSQSVPSWTPCPIHTGGPHVVIAQRDTEQTNLCLAFPALGHNDPDRDPLGLLNAILGEGMSSRLFQSIREEQGLAYDVSSSTSSFYETGVFEVAVGCDPDRIDAVIASVLNELRRLRDEPVTDAELQRIKDYWRGRFVIGLEDTYSVASWQGIQQVLNGEILSIDEFLARIDAVTPADIQRVARRVFKRDTLCLAAIGPLPPAEHFKSLLRL
jgi:predicted Zn-dependent peptidase